MSTMIYNPIDLAYAAGKSAGLDGSSAALNPYFLNLTPELYRAWAEGHQVGAALKAAGEQIVHEH